MRTSNAKKKNEEFIDIIFSNGKMETVDANSIRIHGFKNTFTDMPKGSDYLFACLFEGGGIALIPNRIVRKINKGTLWDDEGEVDVRTFIMSDYNGFSPLTKTEFIKAVKNFPAKRAVLLKDICPDSALCMAFGRESKHIKSFFHGFTNFKYVQYPIKSFNNGGNSFIHLIKYQREDYEAYTILKSAGSKDSDNLLYEYMVGQYVNKQCLRFPCFVETYDWLRYKGTQSCKTLKQDPNKKLNLVFENSKEALKDYSESNIGMGSHCTDNKEEKPYIKRECSEIELLLSLSCIHSQFLAIMIQYSKGVVLMDMLKNYDFINNELITVLYQIYMPLSSIFNEFTHYDLHIRNVLVYEPAKGYYFDYKYILDDGSVVEFKSRYIAKIIDYGRAFFNDPTNEGVTGSSKSIQETICNNVIRCDGAKSTFCGENHGYHFEDVKEYKSSERNISHDLLLLHMIKLFLKYMCIPYDETETDVLYKEKINIDNELVTDFFSKVEYGDKETSDWKQRSTSEIYYHEDGKVNNVIDVHNELKHIVQTEKEKNDILYTEMKSLGTLTIYQSGKEMEFLRDET